MALPPLLPPRTVLVIDDDGVVRRVAQRHLSDAGYRVFEAEDGQEALEVLARLGAVDLVLVDIVMPRMDGAAFVRRLLTDFPDQPVVYMSAYPAEILVTYDAAQLTLPFLAKPFTRDELLGKLEEALVRPGASAPPTDGSRRP